jgi:hypothetical protein
VGANSALGVGLGAWYVIAMRTLALVAALLALGGCKGGWTKCDHIYIWPADGSLYIVENHLRYRILGTDPLVVEWKNQDGTGGVTEADKVRCF